MGYRLLICGIALAGLCLGTSVVGLWTPSEIAIGADSKRTSKSGVVAYGCKVRTRGNCVFSSAGIEHDPLTGFSAEKLGESALSSVGNIKAKFDLLKSRITAALRDVERRRPGVLYSEFGDAPAMEFLVGCFDADGPTILSADVMVSADGKKITFDPDQMPGPKRMPGVVALGEKQALRDQQSKGLFPRPGISHVDLIRDALQIEAKAVPETVGGRLSILVIDQKGILWVERGECPN